MLIEGSNGFLVTASKDEEFVLSLSLCLAQF